MDESLNKYSAEALCTNCGFKGQVSPEVGKHVSQHPCPVCKRTSLRPTAEEDHIQDLLRDLRS